MGVSLTPGVDGRTVSRAVRWLEAQRAHLRRRGRPLSLAEHRLYAAYFTPALLRRVRVAVVDELQAPDLSGTPRHLDLGSLLDLAPVEAMAFIDTVALVRRNLPAPEQIAALLFHELVHLEQVRRLGLAGFVRRYLEGWLAGGHDYDAIPLERQAFELEGAFTRNRLSAASVSQALALPAVC